MVIGRSVNVISLSKTKRDKKERGERERFGSATWSDKYQVDSTRTKRSERALGGAGAGRGGYF